VVSLFPTHLCLSHVELPSGDGDGDGEGSVAAYSEQKLLPRPRPRPRRGGLAPPASGESSSHRVPWFWVPGEGDGLGSVYLYQNGPKPTTPPKALAEARGRAAALDAPRV
jgi:hypothetical protein